jgi:serine/threonine protein kinase
MVETSQRLKLGPYALLRPLEPVALAARWLALHEVRQTSHILYRFPVSHDKSERRRFLAAIQAAARLDHPHILRIEQFAFDTGHSPWAVTPFTGNIDGLWSLNRLLAAKGGSMSPDEAERTVVQLLEALEYAHNAGQHHGPLDMDGVLVDRHGSLVIELFGLERHLRGLSTGNSELVRDEVRSVVEIGYQLVTALPAEDPLIPAGRLVKRLDPRWDRWFATGLDASGGFATAAEAKETLTARPAGVSSGVPVVTVRGVFERLGLGRRYAGKA